MCIHLYEDLYNAVNVYQLCFPFSQITCTVFFPEYIEFWLDNIHCYSIDNANTAKQYSEGGNLNPPVIIVCTKMDLIEKVYLLFF